MNLHFLGRPYAANAHQVETSELSIPGKYRGSEVAFRSAHPKSLYGIVPLQYRGAAYLR